MNFGVPMGMNTSSIVPYDSPNSSFDGPQFDAGGQVYNLGSKQWGAEQWGDITQALNNAIQTAITSSAGGGTIFIPNGDYYISGQGVKLDSLQVSIVGNGARQCRLHYTGTGACITWRLKQQTYINYTSGSAAKPSTSSTFGAKITGISIDGQNAGPGAIGIEYGDMDGAMLDDVIVQSFSGVGSVGIHVNNVYTWTEEARWNQIECVGNTIGILFDRQNRTDTGITLTNGNATFTDATCTAADVGKTVFVSATSEYLGQIVSVSGTTVTVGIAPTASAGVQSLLIGGTTSWDYHKMYGIWLGPNNGQVGMRFQNGGQLAASILHVTGNCGYQSNSSIFFHVTGNSTVDNNTCHFAIENDGTAKSGTFIQVDAGSTLHMNGTVYAGNFGVDSLGGTFLPSGSWQTPSVQTDMGTTVTRNIQLYGTYAYGNYAVIGTDGAGGTIIANAARSDAVTFGATTTVNDTKVLQADVGKQVIVAAAGTSGLAVGANIGTVASVIPGVSFTLSTAHGRTLATTATLTLQGYAMYFRPQGSSTSQMFLTYSGTLNVAAGINTSPIGSVAASMTLGTALQNLGNNALLTVYLKITANTSLVIKAGVANSSAGATTAAQTIITGSTLTGIVPIPLIVPNNYYSIITTSGTGTVAIMGAMYTYQ